VTLSPSTTSRTTFEEVLAITTMKSSYCRHLDTKDFDALCELLTEDVTVAYGGGAIQLSGRGAVRDYLTRVMSDPRVLTSHLVSNPEIEIEGDVAKARWALIDTVIMEDQGLVVRGSSIYEDFYVRTPEGWRIKHTGYKRLFEELGPRQPGTRTTAAYFGTAGRSSLV
jgi:ketosteroid isomerase-like protein